MPLIKNEALFSSLWTSEGLFEPLSLEGYVDLRTLTLVTKNLSRRKGRAIISSIGLILAVTVIVATLTVSGAMQARVGDELEKYGPSIVVTANSKTISIPYGSVVVGSNLLPEETVDKIFTIPYGSEIRGVSAKLYNQIRFGNSSVLVVGLVPESEILLKSWWNFSGKFPQNDTNEVMVGSAIASALKLQLGSNVSVGNSSFVVSALLAETGSVDDYSVFMALGVSQRLFGREGKVSEISVGVTNDDSVTRKVSEQISATFPDVKAAPIKQAVGTRTLAVQQTTSFSLLLASIILTVGVASVMNTMQASINQRIGEIGVLVSLGADKSHLYKMFFSESIILGLIGGVIGAVVGVVSAFLAAPFLAGTAMSFAEVPLYVVPLAIGLSVLASVAASIYPTWRASKIDPVRALKAI